MFEIIRRECKEIRELKGWRLIYGRRKVGKTYLATKCLKYDEYYLISRTLRGRGVTVRRGDKEGNNVT